MAFIPLRQTVTITRSTGELDEWGRPIMGEPETFKCRARETSEVVENPRGEEVVAHLVLLLDRLVAVGYGDDLTYTNEIGHTIAGKPKKVSVIRDFSGKALFTKVHL